jgi:uncharacterized protein (DUF885 family)
MVKRWLLALVMACTATVYAQDAHETTKLHALFDRQWEWSLQRFPESATWRGDHRYDDRLSDESAQARAESDAADRSWLAEARAIRRERLAPADRVSLDVFIDKFERAVEWQAFEGARTLQIGAQGGLHTSFAGLLRQMPMESAVQARRMLARMAAYPAKVDQQIASLRRGMALGWVTQRPVLERALQQIDGQLPADLEAGPFYQPFKKLGAAIPPEERARLEGEARAAIGRHVAPALRKLRTFVADEYLPRAPAGGGMGSYPGGARVYEVNASYATTTRVPPAQIHDIGLRELARIRAEMEDTMRRTGFTGSFAQFVAFLHSDAKFFHKNPESLLDGYRAIAKRIDAEMPRLFAELPRAPYGVRDIPAFQGVGAAEYYNAPSRDGSRAGYFNANILAWKIKPTWAMASLTAHEAAPGHHTQVARSMELASLPKFRAQGGYNAFGEGWALYAETLGREIGLYDDPYSLFGHLQYQALRAARLVVDTGLHSKGWSREQAIEFMVERTGMDRVFISQEVDRYLSWPGQALGYMIGQLKILELRERAKARLGDRFDLRHFNNAIIDNGALPLDVLDKLMDEWLARQAR